MKALTVGGAMIDTIAVIANERIERMTMRNADTSFLLLEEGRKNEAEDISTHCGGGAVNAAVALARLGHDVAALVKLGQDARAETILSRLAEEGVSTRFALRDARAPTGASVLVSAHDRNAAIFTFRGANTLLRAKGPQGGRVCCRRSLCVEPIERVCRLLPADHRTGQGQRRARRDKPGHSPAFRPPGPVPRHRSPRSTFSPSIATRPARSSLGSSRRQARAGARSSTSPERNCPTSRGAVSSRGDLNCLSRRSSTACARWARAGSS